MGSFRPAEEWIFGVALRYDAAYGKRRQLRPVWFIRPVCSRITPASGARTSQGGTCPMPGISTIRAPRTAWAM